MSAVRLGEVDVAAGTAASLCAGEGEEIPGVSG